MGRRRKTDKHLPERVYMKFGAYYYVDANNKWTRLGKTLPEAMIEWAKLVDNPKDPQTMGQVLDRYMAEVSPKKSEKSFKNNQREVVLLRAAFGHMPPHKITPVLIYKYLDVRGKKAPTAANREIALLSHAFTMAVRWGIVSQNPCREVRKPGEKQRDRYVENSEYLAVRALAPDNIRNMLDCAYITGLRQSDLRLATLDSIRQDGLYIEVQKSRRRQLKMLFTWTNQLRNIVERSKAFADSIGSNYLFPNLKGKPYTVSGFQSQWQRLIKKALSKGVIKETFCWHDVRRKAASDTEQAHGREAARQLLGHVDQKTTEIYISGTRKVKPLEYDFSNTESKTK